jgi:acetate kinase
VALAGTDDMKTVIERAGGGEPSARLALNVYVHRSAASIAAMVTSMGGIDVLAFTGGVGENAPEVRRRVAERVAFLGVALDPVVNAEAAPDADVGDGRASVRCVVIEAREDLEIATEVHQVLDPEREPRE